MEKKCVKTFIKILRIALAFSLLGASLSFAFAFFSRASFFFSLTALSMILAFFFGFALLVLLIFWD